jgi:hypothetical protein
MDRTKAPSPLKPEIGTLDPQRVGRLRQVGYLLDDAIPIPGTSLRFGIDSVIGLVPGLGDLVGGALSLYILFESARMGVPRSVLARMGWNVAIDTLVGEVPLLGDLFDAGFKANMRNLALLEGVVQAPVEARRANRRFVALVGAGLMLLILGSITLAVVLVRLVSEHLQTGPFW